MQGPPPDLEESVDVGRGEPKSKRGCSEVRKSCEHRQSTQS